VGSYRHTIPEKPRPCAGSRVFLWISLNAVRLMDRPTERFVSNISRARFTTQRLIETLTGPSFLRTANASHRSEVAVFSRKHSLPDGRVAQSVDKARAEILV